MNYKTDYKKGDKVRVVKDDYMINHTKAKPGDILTVDYMERSDLNDSGFWLNPNEYPNYGICPSLVEPYKGAKTDCDECDGSGEIEMTTCRDGIEIDHPRECDECNGTGRVASEAI